MEVGSHLCQDTSETVCGRLTVEHLGHRLCLSVLYLQTRFPHFFICCRLKEQVWFSKLVVHCSVYTKHVLSFACSKAFESVRFLPDVSRRPHIGKQILAADFTAEAPMGFEYL